MSVENWGICPNCKMRRDKKIKTMQEHADKQYGKISADA